MQVEVVRLADFRNYRQAEFRPAPGVTVVSGGNGSGKSNLLESIGLFATLGSSRAGQLGVLVREGAQEAGARLESDSGCVLEVRVRGGRTLLKAGGAAAVARAFLGRFRAVLFTPEDLDLVRGEPELRRRALDELIVQVRPAYRGVRREYDRALRQRNTALRHGRPDEAASYHHPLAEAGAHVLLARRELLGEVAPLARELYEELAGRGTLDLRYRDTSKDDRLSGPELVEHLLRRYEDGLATDLDVGSTRVGPHRDDLEILVSGAAARSYASRGEQRSAALAFRLAELRVLSGAVLVLDDVLSELDADRRTRVFKTVGPDVQVVVGTADRDAIPATVDVSSEWTVVDGTLRDR